MSDGPMTRYRALMSQGALNPDPAQLMAVEKLQLLHQRLIGYNAARGKRVASGFLGFGRKAAKPDSVLTGLYIFGDVGRGKSLLMDLFFEGAPVARKRRVHFHAFMQEVHAGIHFAREAGVDDPVPPVVEEIAEGATLLCFDELQVTDIADAMILGRLFEGLFSRGVVVVATSNRPPDDLYKDGLNRALFEPFIDMLKRRLDLHELASPTDHRQAATRGGDAWRTPLGQESAGALDAEWRRLTGDAKGAPLELRVQGRTVVVPRHCRGVARAGFADLCTKPLGAADYLAIASAIDTLIVEDIPRLSRARNNEAKRFVTLVDVMYEKRIRLICSAEAEPDALYTEGEGAFEFVRTASRLTQMRGTQWPSA